MYSALLYVQIASIFILSLEVIYIFLKLQTRLQGILLFSCLVTLVNNVGYYLEMIAPSEVAYAGALKMSYLGRAWIPFSLLLFSLNICNIKYKKGLIVGLSGAHFATIALVLGYEHNTLYYSSSEYVTDGLFAHLEMGHGPWHIVYTLLLVGYMVFGVTNLVICAIREKNPTAKKRFVLVVCSIAVECFFYILQIINIAGAYDLTVLGYTLGAIIMCIAIFGYDLLDTLEAAREYVIEEIPEGVVIFNQNGIIEYVNKAANDIFDQKQQKEQLQPYLDGYIEDNSPIQIGERIFSVERKRIQHKDSDGGTVYVLTDDTNKYNYMKELKEQKELAENANASKSAFLSVVSHEIRTPMNAVVSMTDLLLKDKESLSDKQEKYLTNIKNSGSALVMIVNDILDQSKIDAGKMEIIEESYEIRPMVSDVLMIIEDRIGDKPIKLESEIDDKVPLYLLGDSLRIRQILINLLNNAVKFTEDGFIRLGIHVAESNNDSLSLRFSIKDSGQGIKPEDLVKLGQAFSQVDSKRNYGKEGTGLGLSISKDFISMMGGQLEVKSVYGQGSEFYFVIRQGIADGLNMPEDNIVQKQAWQAEEEFTCPEAKVLVVDDTKVNLMIVEELLKPLGLKIDTASSGKDALELVERNWYDMVFMDYMMPYMDGVETTKKIRSMTAETSDVAVFFKKLPIVALTADYSEETREKFAEAGINDYAEKPVNMKRIKSLLLKWLPHEMIIVSK